MNKSYIYHEVSLKGVLTLNYHVKFFIFTYPSLSEPDRTGQLNQERDQSSVQNFIKSGFNLNRDKIRQIEKLGKPTV